MIGLAVIPYSVSLRDFMNSRPINSKPWSYVISIGLGYLVNHVVSTKFPVYIALLLSYCAIWNRHVTGYITITAFRCKFVSFPFFL